MKHLPVTAMRSNGADYVRTYHHVSVDGDVTLNQVLTPTFWAHHTASVRIGDLIDVLSDNLDVQLRVVEKGVGYVRVRPRLAWVAEEAKSAVVDDKPVGELPDNYQAKRGPGGRWRVFMVEPYLEIRSGLATEADAVAVAQEHASKAVAA